MTLSRISSDTQSENPTRDADSTKVSRVFTNPEDIMNLQSDLNKTLKKTKKYSVSLNAIIFQALCYRSKNRQNSVYTESDSNLICSQSRCVV